MILCPRPKSAPRWRKSRKSSSRPAAKSICTSPRRSKAKSHLACYKARRKGTSTKERAMKYAVLFVLLLVAEPAFAQDKLCIDASGRDQYNARPISQHEVLAKNAFGADHRAARLGTTCIHIYRESNI